MPVVHLGVRGSQHIVDIGVEEGGGEFQSSELEGGGGGSVSGVAQGIDEVPQVGVEAVPLEVGGQGQCPPSEGLEAVRGGEVGLLLAVAVVHVHGRHVEAGVGEVVEVVVGVLAADLQGVPGGEVLLEGALGEEVVVPLAVLVYELAADHSAGIAPLRVVEIDLGPPVSALNVPEEGHLGAGHPHVSVLADAGGVVAVLLGVGELVPAGGIEEFGAGREGQAVRYLMLPEDRGVDGHERAALEAEVPVVALAVGEAGLLGPEVDGVGGGVVLGGLEGSALLTVVEGDRLHVVEGEAAEVHYAVLGVAELHPVVEYSHVLAAEAADVDALEPADAAEVLDLYPGEVPYRIGYRVGAEASELLAREHLYRDDLLGGAGGDHHHLVDAEGGVGGPVLLF